jgi:type IV pilus assembly protein PilB
MKKRIGDILIQMGFIDQGQLEMALIESKKTSAMLGDVLLRLDWITGEQLQNAIAVQSGAEILDTSAVAIDNALIAKIPVEFVSENNVFPFSQEDKTIKMATANPFDVLTKDEVARMTGCRVKTYLAPKEWIANAVELHYKRARTIDEDIEKLTISDVGEDTSAEDQFVKLADLLIE